MVRAIGNVEILIATGHILGAVVAVVAIEIAIMLLGSWESERKRKQRLEEFSTKLGVPVEELYSKDLAPRVVQLSVEHSSSELLRNRVSDLCGALRTVWGWLGSSLQLAVLLWIIWLAVTDSPNNATYAWFIVGIAIVFWLIGVVFSFTCWLLTGRYPGEAKRARKAAEDYLRCLD